MHFLNNELFNNIIENIYYILHDLNVIDIFKGSFSYQKLEIKLNI